MKITAARWPVLALVSACASTSPGTDDVPVRTGDASSLRSPAEWNDSGSVWAFVASKYDADGDARVTLVEYTRDDESFDRMDRDADGALTEADFPSAYESLDRFRQSRAHAVVERYMQDDDAPEKLTLDELFVSAGAYDRNDDELVGEQEFRDQAAARRQEVPTSPELRMMGEFDPWDAVVAIVDEDHDGALSFAELGAFFEANDEDADFVWNIDSLEAAFEPDSQPVSGPTVGSLAPDFVLAPPDGGDAVQLSSFRDDMPVALIFGSAT